MPGRRLRALSLPVTLVIVTAFFQGGCASVPATPPATVAPVPPIATRETKLGWIVRLEQQRVLRDQTAPLDGMAWPIDVPVGILPARVPDLGVLAHDSEPPIRHRAALAIGRVGLPAGVELLRPLLSDPEPEVRAMAAFALGLIGEGSARPSLESALADPDPSVRGRAAEALGLIADSASAPAVAQSASGCAPLLAPIEPDDETWPMEPAIEQCRLALFALARLRQFDALAQVAIGPDGHAVSRWWPVAFALQRIGDPRAAPYLLPLASSTGVYTRAFALRGLAAAKDPRLQPVAAALAEQVDLDIKLRVAAVRALGQAGDVAAIPVLTRLLAEGRSPVTLIVETLSAAAALKHVELFDAALDWLNHSSPAVRAEALRAAAASNPDAFLLVLAGLGRDPVWSVRAALASVLQTLPADRVLPAVEALVNDEDPRVHGPALEALVALRAPNALAEVRRALAAPDFVEREIAATLMAQLKPESATADLTAAYERGLSDASYSARLAAIEALAKVGGAEAAPVLRQALGDIEWPVRVGAAALLHDLGEAAASPERPAPVRLPLDVLADPTLIQPAYSPHAFLETVHGTVEMQLDVVAAPVTVRTFIEQARSGFFNGMPAHRIVPGFVVQAGDPRGDGNGGPGYTMRDELSDIPFLRGTMGVALAGPDTGGSQWFVTLGPQPHLDGKYTVFGRVVNGAEVLDAIEPWDVIERVRIWDGEEFR